MNGGMPSRDVNLTNSRAETDPRGNLIRLSRARTDPCVCEQVYIAPSRNASDEIQVLLKLFTLNRAG